MNKKQIDQMRRIQEAFKKNKIDFIGEGAVLKEEGNVSAPKNNNAEISTEQNPQNLFIELIQNERNASRYYTILASKANYHKQSLLSLISDNAKQREDSLSEIYTKKTNTVYVGQDRNINNIVPLKDGIIWAIEVENDNILKIASSIYKDELDLIIQKKFCDINLLHLALNLED